MYTCVYIYYTLIIILSWPVSDTGMRLCVSLCACVRACWGGYCWEDEGEMGQMARIVAGCVCVCVCVGRGGEGGATRRAATGEGIGWRGASNGG